jgi:cAMP-dependent protein kinase regulator
MATSVQRLKDRAWRALRRGKVDRALRLYEELEGLEPGEPVWPARLAEVHRLRGDREAQLAALVRAAERYAQAGLAAQAIATCKVVLSLEPAHPQVRERLLDMCARRGIDAPRLPEPPPAADPGPPPPRGDPEAPLEEILLTEVVAEARPALVAEEDRGGVAEIPLDLSRPDLAGGAPSHPLARTPLFASLPYDGLRELIDGARLVGARAGDVIFREGDPADALYVVAQGAVVPVAEGETRRRLAVLEEGSFFGEIGLVTDQPRNATVEAIVETRLLAIDRPLMWTLVRRDRRIFRDLLRVVRERLLDRLVQTSPLFAALARAERADLADHFRFLEVQAGSELIVEGEPSGGLYVVMAGSVEVVRRRDGLAKRLAVLGPGEFFGEMSLLTGSAAVASVLAVQKSWILALGDHLFHAWSERCPELERAVARVADERWRARP